MTGPHTTPKWGLTPTLLIWGLVAARLVLTLVYLPLSLSMHKTDLRVWFIALVPVLVCGFLAFAITLRLRRASAKRLNIIFATAAIIMLPVWEIAVNAVLGEPTSRFGFFTASVLLDLATVLVFLVIRLLRPVYVEALTE